MNFLNSKTSILLGPSPSKEQANYLCIKYPAQEKLLTLIISIVLVATIYAFFYVSSAYNIFNGFNTDAGLSALNQYIFGLLLLSACTLGILTFLYFLLVSLYAREVVLINNGILEISYGLTLLRVGFRAPVSEVRFIELRHFKNEFSAAKRYQEFLISLDDKVKSLSINNEFTEQDLRQLQSALTNSKQVVDELASQSLRTPVSNEPDKALSNALGMETNSSVWAMLFANCIPLFGAHFLGWQLAEIMLIYWAETLVLFLYQSIRNFVVSPINGLVLSLFSSVPVIFFASMHFLFIWVIFVQGEFEKRAGIADDSLTTVSNFLINLWPALLALLVSHGYSLYLHFFKNPATHKSLLSIKPLFFRIVAMQIIVVVGASLVLLSNGNSVTLTLLVIMKTAVDARAHSKHQLFRAQL